MSATLFDFFGVEADLGKTRTSDAPEPVVYRPLKATTAPKLSGETWEPYRLSSIAIDGARTHGTPLVESSILASVRMPVPSYRPLLPPSVISKGLLSAEQLENVIFAGEQHQHTFPLTRVVRDENGEAIEEARQETRYGFFIGDGTGVGKGRAQPLSANILTPEGWTEMGLVRPGDTVIAADGTPTRVAAIIPQGRKPIFRVTFNDGTWADATDDHLWLTQTKRQRYYERHDMGVNYPKPKILTTNEIRQSLNLSHSIPLVGPVEFMETPVPIDPYVLGVIIADGHVKRNGQTEFATGDTEIVRYVADVLPPCLSVKPLTNHALHYGITGTRGKANPLGKALCEMQLAGVTAKDKFIPDEYKINSVDVRLGILRGLMDSDGTVGKNGSAVYYTISNQLAEDVIFLVQSLGGTCTRSIKKTTHNDCHVVFVKMPEGMLPFRLTRKALRCRSKWIKYPPQRTVVSVAEIGEEEAQCIEIDHPSHLYVTDNFVVTHNCVSGILLDNADHGRTRAVWLSQSQILINDAVRDWTELGGAKSDVIAWASWGLREAMDFRKGILFGTYALLRQRKVEVKSVVDEQTGFSKQEKIVVTRLNQLVDALGSTFDGVIVFDECHNAGNADPAAGENVKASQQGQAVLELQARLPFARIVYVSATGAARVDALSYAPRLGLWKADGAFKNRDAFVDEMTAAGTSALEMVSRDLKALGRMSSRSLSYEGITYQRLEYELTADDIELYNGYNAMWRDIDQRFKDELVRLGGAHRGRDGKIATFSNATIAAGNSALQSRRQSFYAHVLLQLKMGTILAFAKQRLDAGRSVIMQLTHTNEAAANRAIGKMDEHASIDDIDLTQRDLMIDYVRRYYPVNRYQIVETTKDGLVKVDVLLDDNGDPVVDADAVARRDDMLDMLDTLLVVRDGPLEMIYDFFGGDELVAEVTGRSRKIVKRVDPQSGEVHRVLLSRGAKENERETEAFINGNKRVLVFSEAAGGTGRSYHADIRFKNHQPRTHILLEMSWRAESAVQSLGRSHRSNQVCPPEIIFPTTNVPGEKRFASTPARRIAALGALSRGDRTAASNGVFRPEDNLETPYALKALKSLLDDISKGVVEGLEPAILTGQLGLPCEYQVIDPRTSELCVTLAKNSVTIPKFLNRLLAADIGSGGVQERIMEEFMARIDTEVQNAIAAGEYDLGVQQLRARSIIVKERDVIAVDTLTKAKTELLTIEAQRIPNTLSYESALMKLAYYREHQKATAPHLGFFSTGTRIELRIPSVVSFDASGRPNIRVYGQLETDHRTAVVEDLEPATALSDDEARTRWNDALAAIPGVKRKINAVVGAITPIWQHLPWHNPEIYQINADDGERIIARVLTEAEVEATLRALGRGRLGAPAAA